MDVALVLHFRGSNLCSGAAKCVLQPAENPCCPYKAQGRSNFLCGSYKAMFIGDVFSGGNIFKKVSLTLNVLIWLRSLMERKMLQSVVSYDELSF